MSATDSPLDMDVDQPGYVGPQAGTPAASSVRVRCLTRAFDGRTVLDGVDFDLAQGEVIALIGASGSGKSTILRVLAGLDHGAEGSVSAPVRRAVVFQDHRLMPWKKVWANVVLGLEGGSRAQAEHALAEVGLSHVADAWPGTLSGGEAQRVALARALVRDPDLLLLDEPFGALDALTRLNAQRLFADLVARHRPSALLVTHDVEEALLLGDRVLLLDRGRIAHTVIVPKPAGWDREHPEFVRLRAVLLESLGL